MTITRQISIQEMADRLAIQELVFNYNHALDSRDQALFGTLWARDASWEFPQVQDMHMQGYDSIIGFFARPVEREPSHHMAGNLVLSVEGDRASGRSKALSTGYRNPHFVSYQDEFLREDGKWRFLRRVVQAHLPDPSHLPGEPTAEGAR